ncbi:hypothetical protein ISF_09593 [Cordyceps fumosorosea ARSEF 2679]|uniref:ZN622/Rei1/Reh1 zinc finger C2H2-type domain-containing protein n=1 Tax=Cordyceps fumosorosea (strain ARSEF 2679) TaxID=1081104 RepID=A0A162LVC1_CORFA|nr:hypothetical protein ISF_09593 [Cordyceps fumosorosea ARSEF 2679]OAA45360.1 hypothetical protein ISF_09593 [Cordyceps fumosorosea ARSEF 2679]
MESKAPSFCRLCDISLDSPSVWRQHAKSDSHVYKLRVKFAEPGTVITPPSSSPRKQGSAGSSRHAASDEESDGDSDSEDLKPDSVAAARFDARQCLFCNTESTSFHDSLQHMSKMHGFTMAHQEHLTVDAETMAAYLHLVIHGYQECIQCGCRRRTVEGIQHHMIAKGHCRFDVSSEMEDFYDMPSQKYTADAELLHLPSGKVLSNAGKDGRPLASRTPRALARRRHMALARLANAESTCPCTDPPDADGIADAQLSSDTQLSRPLKGDQQSLAHLRDYQVQSLVATGARAVDEARREAKHSELKLSKAGNVTLMGTFRADTSKRFRGPWG